MYSQDLPNSKYIASVYFINGGPLSANAIRVEIMQNKDNKAKNIYYEYNENKAKIKWIDDDNIIINDIKLNIHKDTYQKK